MTDKQSNQVEIVDLESFAKGGKQVPRGHRYRIRVDREQYVVDDECMTGMEILELAGKIPPQKYQLNLKLRGGQVKKILHNEEVCFTTPGVERFMTLPLDQTEGNEATI